MTKTEHCKLPQWEANDPVRRKDFNEAFAAVDTIYLTGSYIGDGTELSDGGLFIELGFRPKFVIISRGWAYSNSSTASTFMITESATADAQQYATLEDTGFTVGQCSSAGMYAIKLNTADIMYSFVAFR